MSTSIHRQFGQLAAAGTPNLVCKKSQMALLYSIVMRFDNPFLVAVSKPNHPPMLDGCSEQMIDVRFHSLQVVDSTITRLTPQARTLTSIIRQIARGERYPDYWR